MGVKRMQRAKLAAAYLLLALAAALGWLYSCLPDRVYLEPGQALYLPRFAWVEPQRGHGSQNVASTRAVGSYQTTLTLGGWLPIKTIRAVVTERPRVTVCGTPFGVKMFSEGALIVGFSEIGQAGGGTSNPAKEAGLHLGDRVICIGQTRTESNEAVKEALDAAEGQDRVYLEPGQALYLPRFAWVEPQRGHGSQNVASTRAVGSYQTTLTLGGWLPIKTIRAVVTERPRVTVCGTPFGVKMFSEGALIVGFSEIGQAGGGTSNPAKEAGLHLGDRVICIGQTRTESNEAVKEALDAAEGQSVEVVYIRSGEQKLTTLTPVWDGAAGQWRAGMWVRDSSAGVGTLTFADEELGVFAGLGHPISDSDTGESVALRSGEIVPCEITGCSAGTAGSPGELKGHFLSAHAIGTIRINGENGVYGTTRTHFSGQLREIAFAQEVVTGPAEIWATIEGEAPRAYRIQIERVSDADPRRNLVIRVIDPSLLSATGGIVQGMSGSPILQNGRLVGAVTHVLVNDPTRGYGIFAQTMLEQAKNAAQNGTEAQTAE